MCYKNFHRNGKSQQVPLHNRNKKKLGTKEGSYKKKNKKIPTEKELVERVREKGKEKERGKELS